MLSIHSKILSQNLESYKPRRTGAVKASLYKNSERRSSQVSDNLNFIYDKSTGLSLTLDKNEKVTILSRNERAKSNLKTINLRNESKLLEI